MLCSLIEELVCDFNVIETIRFLQSTVLPTSATLFISLVFIFTSIRGQEIQTGQARGFLLFVMGHYNEQFFWQTTSFINPKGQL